MRNIDKKGINHQNRDLKEREKRESVTGRQKDEEGGVRLASVPEEDRTRQSWIATVALPLPH